MILAIDIGNTNIVLGCIDDEKVLFTERISTDTRKTDLEHAISIKTVMELHKIMPYQIDGAIISSVV
ncbi:MAG: type III pantothenate kinase, partial [Lachnospiraceae bacterium]|nr:type III pantothenate kinase [Lachnospiraceae bacterium]